MNVGVVSFSRRRAALRSLAPIALGFAIYFAGSACVLAAIHCLVLYIFFAGVDRFLWAGVLLALAAFALLRTFHPETKG